MQTTTTATMSAQDDSTESAPMSSRSTVSIEACVGATMETFQTAPDETERARMMCDLTRLLRTPFLPESTRHAGLTLIGWLARRMPGEDAHDLGVSEARAESECRLRSASRKSR